MPVLVFDFFGVICSEIAPFVLPRYMSAEAAVEYKETIVRDADLGLISQQQMFEDLSRLAGAPAGQLEEEFWARVRIDSKVVDLIERVRRHHRVALLTNAIVPFVRQVMAQFDLERLFETILVSAEEGLAKPDPVFYTRMVERLSVPASDCLFTDDNPANLAGARAAGMNAILFETAEKLERDIRAMGIAL
jgi:HAD superfamily hydrolase (TIGR01509 family)